MVSMARGRVTACDLPHVAEEMKKSLRVLSVKRENIAPADRSICDKAEAFIRAVIEGKCIKTPLVAMPSGSPVQEDVWRCLQSVKYGNVVTYGALAARIGRPRAARAVGQACGANPIPLFIPCHRVLAANGAWGGFSGGLAWKKWLLTGEKSAPSGKSDLREQS